MLSRCRLLRAATKFTHELPTISVPVFGAPLAFPVRRVYCVGQNYLSHANEMGNKGAKEPPFFFTKPYDAVVPQNDPDSAVVIPYPPSTKQYDFEVELVVALDKDIKAGEKSPQEAMKSIFGYAVGLDMTRRDMQKECKAKGRPWDLAKGPDHSAPVSIIRRAADIGHPKKGTITLFVNNVEKQRGDLSEMIWPVGDVLVHLSQFVRLKAGDLIFTGTPAGVGPVTRGDSMQALIEGVGVLSVGVERPEDHGDSANSDE